MIQLLRPLQLKNFNPCKDDVSYASLPMSRGHNFCIASFRLQGDERKRV